MARARRAKSAAEVPLAEAKEKVLAWMQERYEQWMGDPTWKGYDTKWATRSIADGVQLPVNRTSAALKSLEKKGLVRKLQTGTVRELARKGGRGYGQSGALSRKVTIWGLTRKGQPGTVVTVEEMSTLRQPLRIVFEGGNLGKYGRMGDAEITFKDARGDVWYRWQPTGDDADEAKFRSYFTERAENPTDDMDRGLILDEGEVFAKTGSHRQRQRAFQVLGRKPQTYYNLFEGDKSAGATRFVVTESEFKKLKDAGVKVTRSRLKVPNRWHPHIDFGGRDANPAPPPTTDTDLTRRLKF